jgi:hypothetical protein
MTPASLERLQPPDFRAVARRGCFVYAYLRIDGTPYYVGIASQYRRPLSKQRSVPAPPDIRRIRVFRSGLTWEQACTWEQRYIRRYGRKGNGTGILRNLTDGGDGALGNVPSAEVRAMAAERRRGQKHTPEALAKISAASKGRVVTAETRAKMAEKARGRTHTAEARVKIGAAHKGKVIPAEQRARHSAMLKGRKLTPEHCAKISAAQKGKVRTPEHQAKLNTPEARAKNSAANMGRVSTAAMKIADEIGVPYETYRAMSPYQRLTARAAAVGLTAKQFKRLTYGQV